MIPLVPPPTLIMQLITPNRVRARRRRALTAVQATADARAAAAALYSKKAKRGAD